MRSKSYARPLASRWRSGIMLRGLVTAAMSCYLEGQGLPEVSSVTARTRANRAQTSAVNPPRSPSESPELLNIVGVQLVGLPDLAQKAG
jgi:hypothetical protein